MAVETATIIVRQGKAYLSVTAQTEAGVFMGTEPVYIAPLTLEALVAALEKVIAAGHPRIPHPTPEEWRRLKDPVLQAAGVKSWRAFTQHSAVYNYTIDWSEQAVTVYIMQLDHLGRAEYASAKKMNFPKETPLRTIVEAILEDVHSRPELQT